MLIGDLAPRFGCTLALEGADEESTHGVGPTVGTRTIGEHDMATKRQRGAAAPARQSVRVSLRLDASAYETLMIHSLKERSSPAAVVSRLITSELRAWHVRANPTARVPSEGSAELADGMSCSPAIEPAAA